MEGMGKYIGEVHHILEYKGLQARQALNSQEARSWGWGLGPYSAGCLAGQRPVQAPPALVYLGGLDAWDQRPQVDFRASFPGVVPPTTANGSGQHAAQPLIPLGCLEASCGAEGNKPAAVGDMAGFQ